VLPTSLPPHQENALRESAERTPRAPLLDAADAAR